MRFSLLSLLLLCPLASAQVVQSAGPVVIPPNAEDGALVGLALDRDGDLLAVGSLPTDGAPNGQVFVYERQAGDWVQTAILSGQVSESFGHAVAVGTNLFGVRTIAVGEPTNVSGGRVYIFEENQAGGWSLATLLWVPDAFPGDSLEDRFGAPLSMEGGTLVVGAVFADHPSALNSGAVYVFEQGPPGWTLASTLYAPTPTTSSRFGQELDLSGQSLVVSNPPSSSFVSGTVEVYDRVGGFWTHGTTFFGTNPNPGFAWPTLTEPVNFAHSVAMHDDRIVVGDPAFANGRGALFVFEREFGVWSATDYLLDGIQDATLDGRGGSRVAIDENGIASVHWGTNSVTYWSRDAAGDFHERRLYEVADPLLPGEAGLALGGLDVDGSSILVGAPFGDPTSTGGWYELATPPAAFGTSLCHGDGQAGTPCPCGAESIQVGGAGCKNSTILGALLIAHGSDSVAANDLCFSVFNASPNQFALLAWGSQEQATPLGLGNGLLCMAGQIQRVAIQATDAAGFAEWGPGPAGFGNIGAGDERLFQVWYRQSSTTFCANGSNLSNGVRMTFQP